MKSKEEQFKENMKFPAFRKWYNSEIPVIQQACKDYPYTHYRIKDDIPACEHHGYLKGHLAELDGYTERKDLKTFELIDIVIIVTLLDPITLERIPKSRHKIEPEYLEPVELEEEMKKAILKTIPLN